MTQRLPRRRAAAARLRPGPALFVGLAVTLSGCVDATPTEMTVEMPLYAMAQQYTGTVGWSRAREMSQEVTSTFSGDPDGVGMALITLNAGHQTVCWSLQASNVVLPATASHIHRGPAGTAGPIALALTAPGGDGSAQGCAEGVSRDLIVEIMSDPLAFYVNVHTSEYPRGAIRAQLK